MKRLLGGWVVLYLLVGGAGLAKAQPDYRYTTFDVPGSTDSSILAINNVGQLMGAYDKGFYLYSGGVFTALTPPADWSVFRPSGINASGQVVGSYYANDGRYHGFLLSGGSYTTLDVPGARDTLATGVNNAGAIVGYSSAGFPSHGFLLQNGSYSSFDVPSPSSTHTLPAGINNAGQIVGTYVPPGGLAHGFLLDGGNYTLFDVPNAHMTDAYGINASGQIVGTYEELGSFVQHGFLLSAGTYTTVGLPDWFQTTPLGINDAGVFVGAYGAGGRFHGFVASPIPEPPTLLLLALSTVGLMTYTWRKRFCHF